MTRKNDSTSEAEAQTNRNYYIDQLDLEILALLQKDARRSFSNIARQLGVSVNTIRNRLNRMIEENVVTPIGRLNPLKVGFRASSNLLVKVIPQKLEETAYQIAEFPEVFWLAIITGEYDISVDVMCRDIEHLTELIGERVSKLEGVVAIRTSLFLRVIKIAQPDINLVRANFTK